MCQPGIVLPVAGTPTSARPLAQREDSLEGASHVALVAHDADELLHHVLQIVLHLVRPFASLSLSFEGRERVLRHRGDARLVDSAGAVPACELRRMVAGPLAEHQQVGERVATEAVGAVQSRRALARREQPGQRRHLRIGVHADPAHDVVRGRADLHRLLGDIDAGELLELVVHARELLLDVLLRIGEPRLDPRDVEEYAPVRATATLAHLADDATGDVVAGQQLRRTPRVLVTLCVAPAFLLVVRGLVLVEVGDVVEHEPLAVLVAQHPALAAHALGHEQTAHTRRPHHPGGMELHELHVHEIRACHIGERLAVPGILPAVAGDLVSASDAAGGEYHGLGAEQPKAATLTVVAESADHPAIVEQQASEPCTPCARRCPGGSRGLAACGSSRGRCDRRRGQGADTCDPRNCAAEIRPSLVRSKSAPHASSSRTRSGASLAWSSAMRQLLTYCPPRMVSAKCTFQLSRSSTLASEAATPPSAITVCALPSNDLQTRPTDTPCAAAAIAALRPAPPAPITSTS